MIYSLVRSVEPVEPAPGKPCRVRLTLSCSHVVTVKMTSEEAARAAVGNGIACYERHEEASNAR